MKIIYVATIALLTVTSAAVAQTTTQKAPGGNLPAGQSACALGYEGAVQDGRMAGLSAPTMQSADTNNDGRLSKAEFDAACASKLFDQQNAPRG
jgi:hypothetical protein